MKDLFKNKKRRAPGRDEPARFFVHIPKTAGTSFRAAVESRFGRSRVLRDYGHASEATSQSIREEVYQKGSCPDLQQAVSRNRAVLVAGHVPITKYGSQIGMRNTITFFRDPVEQVISHYRHAVRDKDYQGDLMSFARLDSTRNIQSRVMANLNPNLVGIVGLTEKYRETLAIVKHRWGWNLQHKRKNVSGRLLLDRFEVSEEDISELEHLNQSDRDLYTRVCQQFRNTWYCLEHETGTDPRGAITDISTDIGLSGWAFDMLSDRPSKIEIFVNGMRHSEVVCNLLVPQIKQWKIPRNGRVGFRTNMESMEIGDRIEVRDVCSGLTLATLVNNGNLN